MEDNFDESLKKGYSRVGTRSNTRFRIPGGVGRNPTRVAKMGSESQPVRKRTIYHPERQREQRPLIQPSGTRYGVVPPTEEEEKEEIKKTPWTIFSRIVTILVPDFILKIFKISGASVIQAWREKVTLCFLVLILSCLTVVFVLFFSWQCNESLKKRNGLILGTYDSYESVLIGDTLYETNTTYGFDKTKAQMFQGLPGGFDVTNQFEESEESQEKCKGNRSLLATAQHLCSYSGDETCMKYSDLERYKLFPKKSAKDRENVSQSRLTVVWGWDLIYKSKNVFIIDDFVVNLTPYIYAYGRQTYISDEDERQFQKISKALNVYDGSRIFNNDEELSKIKDCVIAKYKAGRPDVDTNTCLLSKFVYIMSLVVCMGTLLTRFFMAIYFSWFVSPRLCKSPNKKKVQKSYGNIKSKLKRFDNDNEPLINDADSYIGDAVTDMCYPYTVLLVTCYSEGESSIRNTFDSLAVTEYPDERKLLFVVADGIITGKGNPKSTPDTIVDIIRLDESFGLVPHLRSYIAIANGSKMHNMARVYVGHYEVDGHSVPTVVIVKSGNDEERKAGVKPGNRGKRDSQLILMNFFSRIIMNDLLTPLDYDLFRKIRHISKVTPNSFEIVLMVDADTMVNPKSLKLMINCMLNDPAIMGMCGETKIQNKTQSLITMIQVFEYYISHHLGKAFESIFGGVTCLPGCFCMYRIKGIKDGKWVPLLMNSDIVDQYSSNKVDSLHLKNLLLLGEDRFLSTLMLRTFPERKMVFAPKATCKTVVPDDFKTLLSQRRRWINSTIHNLMELVLVNNLCGTFCFSMQFIILLDLFSTAVLPVSLCLLFYSFYQAFRIEIASWTDLSPLFLLLFTLLLPGVLVLFTTKKVHYVIWMLIYMLALPIWQIILPLYSFWHFDDFSWGETRKVSGEKKGGSHDNGDGKFDPSSVRLERWETYEAEWKKALKTTSLEIKQKRESEIRQQQQQQQQPVNSTRNFVTPQRVSSNNILMNMNSFDNLQVQRPLGIPINNFDQFQPPSSSSSSGNVDGIPKRISSVNFIN